MAMRRWGVILGMLAGLGLWAAGAPSEETVAARVNGTAITSAELESKLGGYRRQQGLGPESAGSEADQAVRRQVLDALLDQELLWQEAQRQGIMVDQEQVTQALAETRGAYPSQQAFLDELAAAGFTEEGYREDLKRRMSVRRLVQEVLTPQAEVTEEEVHAYYLANTKRMRRPEEVRVRHILVAAGADASPQDRAVAQKRIGETLGRAQSGFDFAELAKEVSEDNSAVNGGDLGFIGHGETVPPFEEAAFALQPGEISGVVETRFGYHILKVETRRGGEPVPEAEAEPEIRKYLVEEKTGQALQTHIEDLRRQSEIEILTEK